MQISSNLPPYPNLSTELCHFALLLSTGSIYCEFTASQHCEGQNRYERANTDRTIERHGWFDRSLRNNARASQATDEPGQESSRNYPKTEHFRTTPWSHFNHRTGGRPNWADDIGNSHRRITRAAARQAKECFRPARKLQPRIT